jgi:hypothetical protein
MLGQMTDFSLTAACARARSAVETVYTGFDTLAPPAIEGCPCCIETRGVDVLLTTPLRKLTGHELWHYVSGVFLTIGSERDFRYFLPRILDISIDDPESFINSEIVLGKLRLANWQSWPAAERRIVEELVDAWFELALARDLTEADEWWISTEAESVLCGAALAGLPLAPWLTRLNEPFASPVLTDLKNRYPRQLSAFWKDAPAGLEELSTILTEGER